MILPLQKHLTDAGIDLRLATSATRFDSYQDRIEVTLSDSGVLAADFVVLCIGVRPESKLAVEAGLECGPRGGIRVNSHMETSAADVFAVGDVVETTCVVSGGPVQIPLAGPANRQGRIAADCIFQRESSFRGTQGNAVVGLFGQTAAMTGLSEKVLQAKKIDYEKIYLHPTDHAGYYPGAKSMLLKLLFSPEDGRILGAQATGSDGVDKRIDVIAMAIQARLTVFDLEEAELCYAPQYGHAKDPVNMAGFIAAGVLRGDQPILHASSLEDGSPEDLFLLDVRTPAEYTQGHIPGAVNVPIEELRDRLQEISAHKTIATYCQVGQRGYLATRILLQQGMDARNISGGYKLWSIVNQPA